MQNFKFYFLRILHNFSSGLFSMYRGISELNQDSCILRKNDSFANNPTGKPRRIDFDSTSILHRYVENRISTNFHVISMYFFNVISLIEKSTSFPRTFFDVLSMVEKSTLFPRTFFGLISLVEKSTLFPRTFFGLISLVEKSTLFPRTFFDVISMDKKSTLFPRSFLI